MKYLMINGVCGIRSTGRICTDIADSLMRQDNEVKIAYGREHVPEKYRDYAVRIGTDVDIKLHALRARFLDGTGLGSRESTRKFVHWIEEYNPDIIHLHNLHGYYLNFEILFDYLKYSGKCIVWTLHDCWSFTGHCPYFSYAKCDKWLTGCGGCTQLKEYPKSYTDFSKRNWLKKKNSFTGIPNMTLVTPSHWLAGLVKQSYMGEYTVKVIHNSVDTKVFKPTKSNIKQEYHLNHKKVVLGVASEWNYRKGLNYMVELSEKLGNDYTVVIIGVTEEQKRQLPQTILGLSRTANVKELAEWYSAADVYVNTTLEDNYPTTNLEAIACGTPVVTFDSGGSPESARIYGDVVKSGDIDSLCNIIKRGTYEKHLSDISSGSMVSQYLTLYKEIMGEKI